MSFLTGTRLELIAEYTNPVRQKGKILLPIGLNTLRISKVELTESKNQSPMIVLSIKHYEEDYLTLKLYFLCDYSLKRACDERGVPYGIVKLKRFILDGFDTDLQRRPKLLPGLVDQIKELKKIPFYVIIRYTKKLIFENGGLAERKISRTSKEVGLPVVIYTPEIIQVSSKPISYPVSLHKGLIKQLTEQEQELFDNHLKSLHGTD